MVDRVRSGTVVSGDVHLAALEAGNPSDPSIVLLHGYPDTKELWDAVLDELSGQFHVVAYDARGAGGSSAPRTAAEYDFERLGDDLLAVAKRLCPGARVHFVGHDWGAIQGWEFAADPRFEGVLASMTAIAGPSLDQVSRSLRALVAQRRVREALRRLSRSYYIVLLWIPGVPTLIWRVLLRSPRWRRLLTIRERLAVPPRYPRSTLPSDGIHGANLYRRNIPRRLVAPRRATATHVAVQLIVPTHDRFIPPEHYELAETFAPGLRRRWVRGSHWAPLAEPRVLAAEIARFVDDVEARFEQTGKDSGARERNAEHAAPTPLTRNPHPST